MPHPVLHSQLQDSYPIWMRSPTPNYMRCLQMQDCPPDQTSTGWRSGQWIRIISRKGGNGWSLGWATRWGQKSDLSGKWVCISALWRQPTCDHGNAQKAESGICLELSTSASKQYYFLLTSTVSPYAIVLMHLVPGASSGDNISLDNTKQMFGPTWEAYVFPLFWGVFHTTSKTSELHEIRWKNIKDSIFDLLFDRLDGRERVSLAGDHSKFLPKKHFFIYVYCPKGICRYPCKKSFLTKQLGQNAVRYRWYIICLISNFLHM